MFTADADGMIAVMVWNGQGHDWTPTTTPTTSGQSPTAPAVRANQALMLNGVLIGNDAVA